MHKTTGEALGLVNAILAGLAPGDADVVVCPPFTALAVCGERLADQDRVALGAQDVFWADSGAYTGAVSPDMLLDCGCRYVVVGHSERRSVFHETDDESAKKARAALSAGLRVIFCAGETMEQRDRGGPGGAREAVLRQLQPLLEELPDPPGERLSVAYEPVWAIGTRRAAAPEDAVAAAGWIREAAARQWGGNAGEGLRVLYGGSVTPDNARAFLARREIDGALVGGASLEADRFLSIVAAASRGARR